MEGRPSAANVALDRAMLRAGLAAIRQGPCALDAVCARASLGYNTPDEQELDLPHDVAVERLSAHLQRTWTLMQQAGPPAASDAQPAVAMR